MSTSTWSRHPWILKTDAIRRLGVWNVARVVSYRMRLRLGIHPVQYVRREIGGFTFFRMPEPQVASLPSVQSWDTHACCFGWYEQPLGDGPPDWHRNPFTGARIRGTEQSWWQLSDYDTGAGDIKTVWEASRFDWVLAHAQRAVTGDPASLDRLNSWLADWCQANAAYRGPNWKCGQEASIRVLHLALGARLLGQLDQPESDLMRLVEAHLARIYPTLSYAMAQNNNHGTSEAAALFVGGDWCANQGFAKGAKWCAAGRRWLENRVARLVGSDGGFSQHSVNYHRLMLDTLSLAELWRRWRTLPAFSDRFYHRAEAASRWLLHMTDASTGDAPNLGANDGANLLPLTDADYRDYRPAVQLGMALFAGQCVVNTDGPCYRHLAWLGIESPYIPGSRHHTERSEALLSEEKREISSDTIQPRCGNRDAPVSTPSGFHATGYMILRNGSWKALLRYPHARFRPGHCDALHVDLWFNSENLLRDAGSYSYNTEPELREYFSGPLGHNTVQFDDRDPMPSIGRFLRAHWLDADSVHGPETAGDTIISHAGYQDWRSARHTRHLSLEPSGLRVVDRVSGFRHKAVLRWRLLPGEWTVSDSLVQVRGFALKVIADVPIRRFELVSGWESRYYLMKTPVPVLEVEVAQPGVFTSTLTNSAA